MSNEYLWYIPNTVDAGHRLDDVAGGWANLDLSTELARMPLLPRLRTPVTV